MESVQKELKKPKDEKKKNKEKEKVVDGVNKIEELYDVHVAAVGNVMLIDEIKERVKDDAKTLRNEERTVELFSNLIAKYLQNIYGT